MGDHAEALQVDYDPNLISFQELVQVFWDRQNPTKPNSKRQYMNAAFYHDEKQKNLLEETRAEIAKDLAAPITTHILPAGIFTLAEDYHQKYSLRGYPSLMDSFSEIYPNFIDIVNSTAAARLNGFLSGNGTQEQFNIEIDSYGLPEKVEKKLFEVMRSRYGW